MRLSSLVIPDPPRRVRDADSSKQIQIFVLLPGRHVIRLGILLLRKARKLGFLDVGIVIDESLAERVAQPLIGAQRGGGIAQGAWQRRRARLVWRIGRRTGIKPARDAVETTINL